MCNQVVKQCNGTKVHHRVWHIKPCDIRLVSVVDSSFDFKGERHQQGWIIGYTHQFLNKNMKAPVSIALRRSRKLPRKAGPPQLVETFAGSYGAADMNW
eukprot:3768041-Karenia_brevis.AAC.1